MQKGKVNCYLFDGDSWACSKCVLLPENKPAVNVQNIHTLHKTNRKLKIIHRIIRDGELDRLSSLITKWSKVGSHVIEALKEHYHSTEPGKLKSTSNRDFSKFILGIRDAKVLDLIYPDDKKSFENNKEEEYI